MSDRGKQRDKGGKDLKKDISKGLGELKRKKSKMVKEKGIEV